MSIPSHRIEGRGHNRKVTVTFYGTEMPERFHAGGVEYRMVFRAKTDRHNGIERCRRCHRVVGESQRFCGHCGAELI